MKKFLKTITGAVLAIALCASCAPKQEETAAEPTANLTITVSPLTEEQFAETSTEGLENPVIEDFSNVVIELKMDNMVAGTERSVKMTALKNIMSETGVGTYWYGGGSSQNNADEDFSVFTSENVIYRNGLTDDDIKAMFEGYNAEVTYTGTDGQTVEETIPFIDSVVFERGN